MNIMNFNRYKFQESFKETTFCFAAFACCLCVIIFLFILIYPPLVKVYEYFNTCIEVINSKVTGYR